ADWSVFSAGARLCPKDQPQRVPVWIWLPYVLRGGSTLRLAFQAQSRSNAKRVRRPVGQRGRVQRPIRRDPRRRQVACPKRRPVPALPNGWRPTVHGIPRSSAARNSTAEIFLGLKRAKMGTRQN